MDFEFDIVHGAGTVHQAAAALSRLPTTYGCVEPITDDILLKCIVHYDNEPFLVDPVVDAYSELEEGELFKGLRVIPEDVESLSIAKLVEAQKASFLCGRPTTAVGELGTQFDIDENVILVRRAAIDGSL